MRLTSASICITSTGMLINFEQVTDPTTPEEASLARVLAAAEVEDPHDGDSFED